MPDILPWFPYDIDEWEEMTQTLTLEEEGALTRLIRAAWRDGGALPSDPVVLGVRLERVLGSRWRRYLKLVQHHFPLDAMNPSQRLCPWLYQRWLERLAQREQRAAHRRRAIPWRLRLAVYQRDGRRCVRCGAGVASPGADGVSGTKHRYAPLSLDHIKPYSEGGEDTEANLRTLCVPCNSARGTSAA